MATLPPVPNAVNASAPSQPGFYAIIPASVRYCKDIPAAAKLLFGEIVALTSVKGYCFAQNPYFMDLYDVDRSTIKRWLAALAGQGFIRVELDPSTNERRIYALAMMPEGVKKQAGGVAQKRARGGAETSYPRPKNAPHSITLSITESNKKELLPRGQQFVGPGPVAARDLARTEVEQKGSASPPTVDANLKKLRQVERAVARCGNLSLRSRFSELWDVVQGAGCSDAWQNGLDAAKPPTGPSTGFLAPPSARFMGAVVAVLTARGVLLPDGLAAPLA